VNDLFNTTNAQSEQPLAAALRPQTLDDIVGQEKLVGPGTILRRRITAGQLGSVVLYGPPGIGKTSIARAVGNMLGKEFRPLHATRAGVKDIRKIADEAQDHPILIFVDEVHRFSTTQADDLLAICEEGTADFIGATTQNPFTSLPKALISRSTVLKLEPISIDDMEKVIDRGLDHLEKSGIHVAIPPECKRAIAGRSGGDARAALTTLESLTVGHENGSVEITDAMIEEAYLGAPVNHDRGGDQHYDIISAFVKSLRGSDPDAALYWLARLIHAGEDPRYIARRIMVHASEDVGLADNSALQTAVTAAQAVEMIGYPEARIILAHAALHVCRAPKSNSAYRGINLAMQAVTSEPPAQVPLHLRDTHYKGADKLGHKGYISPHSDPKGWIKQEYAPDLKRGRFYQSDARDAGTFEKRADDFYRQISGKPPIRKF
jgi:putative ATPase